MDELFTLREAREGDLPYIHAYAYAEGMDNPPDLTGITVAVNADDVPVGFCRVSIQTVEAASGGAPDKAPGGAADSTGASDQVAFIHPIVVTPAWRRYGVGKALMEHAAAEHGELRLVSRGGSIAFYRALGFVECAWGEIAPAVVDCDGCELRDECQPLPMRRGASE